MGKISSLVMTAAFAAAFTSAPLGAQTYRSAGSAAALNGSFGGAVAVGDGEVFIGEPNNTMWAGAVYVFRPDAEDGDWTQSAKLTAPDEAAGDGFGAAIAVGDGALLIGATREGGRGPSSDAPGRAYLWQRDATGAWVHGATFDPDGREEHDSFGLAVALAGDMALVGAPGADGGAGAVHVYRRSEAGWEREARLASDDVAGDERFGAALAVADGRILVGAPGNGNGAGTVYVFERDPATDTWERTTELGVGQLQPNDGFGTGLATDGETVVVSTPSLLGGMGGVFVFVPDADGALEPVDLLLPFDGDRRDAFGSALAFDGEELWVGAPNAVSRRGAAFAFRTDEELGWSRAQKVGAIDPGRGGGFGSNVDVRGGVAVAGIPQADYGAGQALVFERDAAGVWRRAGVVMSEVEGLAAVRGGGVECQDGAARVFGCGEIDLVSFLPVEQLGGARGVRLNDVWGWTDPETGKEYVLAGRLDGTSFVDISDPASPVLVGTLPRTEGSPGSTWRDVKVYADHAFVVADGAGAHGMQVFDLTRLREYEGEPITFDEDAHYDRIHSAHNVVINEETGYAYTVGNSSGGETCGGGLHMVDIRDPLNPTFAGCFADAQTGRASTGYTHDGQCVVYRGPDEAYQEREICFGANETALSIADVTDKQNPVAIARAPYPNVSYTHQGWLTEDHRYFFVNDELDEMNNDLPGTRTLIWDVTELEDPQLVKEHFGETKSTDHNLYIVGDLMYQANYVSGLRILDISDPENPREVGFFDTVPWGEDAPGFGGAWSNYPFFESGVIAVTSGQQGLFIVRKKEPVF